MIRAYTSTDKPALLELIRLNTPTYFAKEETTDFSNYLDNELEGYFVVVQDGITVGCGGINYEPNNSAAVISWDIIHPDYQGKGIGKELLQFRITKIKEMNKYSQIIVRTAQFTFDFYKKAGFKLIETKKDYWAKGIDLFYMTMKIT